MLLTGSMPSNSSPLSSPEPDSGTMILDSSTSLAVLLAVRHVKISCWKFLTIAQTIQQMQKDKNETDAELCTLRWHHKRDHADQPPKKRPRHNSPEGHNKEDEDSDTAEDATKNHEQDIIELRCAGRHFILLKQLWPFSPQTMYTTSPDCSYKPQNRFNNSRNRLQGDVHDLLDVVPARFHGQLSKPSVNHEVCIDAILGLY